ncbi:MAG: putative N-acetylmannosamine-6-phosphate 2-epimerase [Acetobacteraceae bacterium]|nr:putative N-acetylmannosamine-6-phosphate 2-epimerase [Acetobacteraceae bacterium]
MSVRLPKCGLIVSCQAHDDNPLRGPHFMVAMAQAAVQAGAGGIRAEGVADIAAIRAAIRVPIIGLIKRQDPGFDVYITPDFAAAKAVADAGADVIAIDATGRPRQGEPLATLIRRIHAELGKPVMADIATLAEAIRAEAEGCDYIGSTMAGYTHETVHRREGPDLELLGELVAHCHRPVIAEGRYDTPTLAAKALAMGAHAVVVGTAVTNPREIARRFVAAMAG